MPSNVNLKIMMQATAHELKDLCQNAEHLQCAIGPQGNIDSDSITSIQRLDYLTQSLEALSELWCSLAQKAPTEWSLEATLDMDNFKLRDLAERLQGKDVVPVEQGCLEEF